MASESRRSRLVTPLLSGAAGLLLVFSVTQPVARQGVGSALSMHELFDLLLSGTIRVGVPRWLGLFGYLPAIGGILVMLAEATVGQVRTVVRLAGIVLAALAVGAFSIGGPRDSLDQLGLGVQLAAAGLVVAIVGAVVDLMAARRHRVARAAGPEENRDLPTGGSSSPVLL